MTLDLETAVARFENLAGPELRRWFPDPNNCIGAVRIITQVFEKLGFAARPLSVVYQCHNAARKMLYISGTDTELKERARRAGCTMIDLQTGGEGWQGHLVAIVGERWFIDPTWMAAGERLGVPRDVEPIIFQIPEGEIVDDKRMKLAVSIDDDTVELHYTPAADDDYLNAPAWELDHVDIAIETLRRKILGVMTPDADIEHFVIYRHPRDFPDAAFVVRRHTLKPSAIWPEPDPSPWAVASGENEDELLAMLREDFRAAGRYRLDRFQADDPCIVEVWI